MGGWPKMCWLFCVLFTREVGTSHMHMFIQSASKIGRAKSGEQSQETMAAKWSVVREDTMKRSQSNANARLLFQSILAQVKEHPMRMEGGTDGARSAGVLETIFDTSNETRFTELDDSETPRVAVKGANVKAHSLGASSRWLIDPRTSNRSLQWDIVTFVALVLTAFFTPFEVSFLPPPTGYGDAVFVFNRFIDAIFIFDVVMQFFVMQTASDKYGDRWITDHNLIIRRYLRGWFALDFGSSAISLADFVMIGGSSNAEDLRALRVIRVLRLTKLLRLARVARMVEHWETRMTLDYGGLALCRIMFTLILCTHWSACLWALGASFTMPSPEFTWLGQAAYCVNVTHPEPLVDQRHIFVAAAAAAPPGVGESGAGSQATFQYLWPALQGSHVGWQCLQPGAVYAAATYWSAMTITSIGYGDISATHGNPGEQALATVIMLLSAFVWGWCVATFCSVIASMADSKLEYRATLDHLNRFMTAEQLPSKLRQRLREYFFKTKHLRDARATVRLFEQMSPRLQAETLWAVNKRCRLLTY